MNTHKTDVIGAYLHEVELRLSGLPLLQRRELLADLEAHISETRTDTMSEGELIEMLERLGSPEVVASAAYEEAGRTPHTAAPARPRRLGLIIGLVVAGLVVLFLIGLAGLMFFAQAGSVAEPAPDPGVATPAVPTPAGT